MNMSRGEELHRPQVAYVPKLLTNTIQRSLTAWHQWLTPAIPAAQEAGIRRIEV
jgi:hypothetical protein